MVCYLGAMNAFKTSGSVRTCVGVVVEAIEPAGNAEENHENA